MKIIDILSVTYAAVSKFSRNRLLRTIQTLREKCIQLSEKNYKLEAENKKLKEELKNQKIKSVNRNANKPSSKRPEWDKAGAGNDGKEKKNRNGRGKKPRKGAGNRPKKLKPDRAEKATVDHCIFVVKICQAKSRLKPAMAESLRTFRMLLKDRKSSK